MGELIGGTWVPPHPPPKLGERTNRISKDHILNEPNLEKFLIMGTKLYLKKFIENNFFK
jgi:hypothetical protein